MIVKSDKDHAMDKMKASFIAGNLKLKSDQKSQPNQLKQPQTIRVVCSTGNGCAS